MISFRAESLDAFMRDLAGADGDIDRELDDIAREYGRQLEGAIQSRASGAGSVLAKASPAIRVTPRGPDMTIEVDGAGAPYAPGAVFGSVAYAQFRAYVGYDNPYAIEPALESTEDDATREYARQLGDIIAD